MPSIGKLPTEMANKHDGTITSNAPRRNTSIEQDVESMRAALQGLETSTLSMRDNLYDFLVSIYTAYLSALRNKELDKLIAACCPKEMRGINKKTHTISKIIKGMLGEKGQDKDNRRKILDWKNCLCGMCANKIEIYEAKDQLSKNGISFFIKQNAYANKSMSRTRKNPKPKIIIADSLKKEIDDVIENELEVTAFIEASKDGTLTIRRIIDRSWPFSD